MKKIKEYIVTVNEDAYGCPYPVVFLSAKQAEQYAESTLHEFVRASLSLFPQYIENYYGEGYDADMHNVETLDSAVLLKIAVDQDVCSCTNLYEGCHVGERYYISITECELTLPLKSRVHKAGLRKFRYNFDRNVVELVKKATAREKEMDKKWLIWHGKHLYDIDADGYMTLDARSLDAERWEDKAARERSLAIYNDLLDKEL